METNKCPKCHKYIFGNYCCKCQLDIRTIPVGFDFGDSKEGKSLNKLFNKYFK